MSHEKTWIYHSDKMTLSQWVENRDVTEADVIEYLIDNYLDDLRDVFPVTEEDPENDLNIKADMRYERGLDYINGF